MTEIMIPVNKNIKSYYKYILYVKEGKGKHDHGNIPCLKIY